MRPKHAALLLVAVLTAATTIPAKELNTSGSSAQLNISHSGSFTVNGTHPADQSLTMLFENTVIYAYNADSQTYTVGQTVNTDANTVTFKASCTDCPDTANDTITVTPAISVSFDTVTHTTSNRCGTSVFKGTTTPSACCQATSCVTPNGTCTPSGTELANNTCHAGTWLADNGRFEVRNKSDDAVFAVDRYGSMAANGDIKTSCTEEAPNTSWTITDSNSTAAWVDGDGTLCAANIETRTTGRPCRNTTCYEVHGPNNTATARFYDNGNVALRGSYTSNTNIVSLK